MFIKIFLKTIIIIKNKTIKYMKLLFKKMLFFFSFGFSFLSGLAAELPMQIINGLPYVEAKVNGQGPYLFGFDTGFGGEVELDSTLAVQLGLKPTGQMEMGDPSGRNSRVMSITSVKQLELGNIELNSSNVILRNRRAMPGMEKVAGILGMSLFKSYLITIDFPKKRFLIKRGSLGKADGKNIFNYVSSGGGVPGIQIKVGQYDLIAFLDTRAMSSYFILPDSLVQKLQLVTAPKVIGKARTVSNEITIIEVQIKDAILIGSNIYIAPTITYPSLNKSGVIGSKALLEYAISIDQKNKRLRLDRTKTEDIQTKKQVSASLDLQEYIGQYGDRKIGIDAQGALFIQRPAGRELKMVAKGKDEFFLEIVPAAIIKFERENNGEILAINVFNQQSVWERIPKNK